MRKFLILFAVLIGAGLTGPMTKDALAQCTHLGGTVSCPVGIANGSNSLSFGSNNTINWSGGQVSTGACCPADAGLGTGAGLLNQNNQLGGPGFHWGPTTTGVDPGAPGSGRLPGDNDVQVNGQGFDNYDCVGGQCTEGPAAAVFGSGPGGGYLCDSAGPGCGNDLWSSPPQPGFGQCGAGGCGGTAPVLPLTSAYPPLGPYAQNSTTGDVDPFGGGPGVFVDPVTGEATDLPDNQAEWPDKIKHADALNNAFANGEIGYPFNDPNWADRSVDYYKNNPTAAPLGPATTYTPPDFYQTETPGFGNSIASAPGTQTGTSGFGSGIASAPGTSSSESSSESSGASSGSGQGPKYSDKAGRFGIGTDTSLGEVGGLSARFQVAKNFGVQAIVSFARIDLDAKEDNSDLTDYVSGIVYGPKVAPATTPAPGVTKTTQGGRTYYTVTDPATGKIGNWFLEPETANAVAAQLATGVPYQVAVNRVRSGATESAGDQIVNNVPNRFRRPSISSVADGTTHLVQDPVNDRSQSFGSKAEAEAMLEALNNGASWQDARQQAAATPVVTPDGLASASSSGTRTTSVVPATPGSAPAPFVDSSRPAIIVKPEDALAPFVDSSRPAIIVAPTPAPATANSSTVPPPVIVPRPTRPPGDSVTFLEEALVQGGTYRIEIVRTSDGRTLAVGTGDNAGHVFGEAKEGGFGWRNEGPWTPPPPRAQTPAPAPFVGNERPPIIVSPGNPPPATLREAVEQANASTSGASTGGYVTAPLPGSISPTDRVTVNEVGGGPQSDKRNENMQVRVQIANSDRDQMLQQGGGVYESPNSFIPTGR